MSKSKVKLSAGFFISCLAIIVSIVGLALYGKAYNTSQQAYTLLIAAVVVEVLSTAGALKFPKVFNWGAPIAGLLAAAGLVYSATVMVDPIGYVVSGLYESSTLSGFITFAVVAGVGWLLYLVASFTGLAKEN